MLTASISNKPDVIFSATATKNTRSRASTSFFPNFLFPNLITHHHPYGTIPYIHVKMDQSLDVSKLSDADKKELSQHLQNESQKAAIQQNVHHLADTCWKKCITSKITSGRLDKNEEACASNCVDRWMDTNLAVLKHLETLQKQ